VSEKLFGEFAKNILVYGWYMHNNIGDDLFIDAFKALFPAYNFIFVDYINTECLQNINAVFIGGGSFLGEPLPIESAAWETLKSKKIFYIGVGAETDFHQDHLQLMILSKLIAIRSNVNFDKVKEINRNTIIIPDLVYSLFPKLSKHKIEKSALILPNISVVPTWNDAHWMHASWEYFKTELAQLLDLLIGDAHTINFLPLCTNIKLNDEWAAAEIISRMKYRNKNFLLEKRNSLQSITELMSQYDVIITQRYHGIVLAQMSQVPCLTISHHDKLKNANQNNISYYGLSKDKLREQFNICKNANVTDILPINRDMFISLQRMVDDALRSS
jgi:polysaccharide pyruvyl transferase WcaK-like protein